MRTAEIEIVDAIMDNAVRMGIAQVTTEDLALVDNVMHIRGQPTRNFGSCSYLGLEHHPALIEGTMDAVRRYGTQFSSSRAYASLTLYREAEELLSEIFGADVILTPSTTLGHLAALPVLVTSEDAALIDRHLHNSAQMAVGLSAAQGAHVEVISHNDIETIRSRALVLARERKRVWYLCDGLYSMYGDFAPIGALMRLLDEIPQLSLYVDDAHGVSWFGCHGRGYALERAGSNTRVVVAAGLAKSFAGGGGVLIMTNAEDRRRVRNCGGTMTFSGPLQPAVLGTLVASAKLHLSDECAELQKSLSARLAYASRRGLELGLPILSSPYSPVRFLGVGNEAVGAKLVCQLIEAGFWINAAGYPSVPMGRAGIRFTITNKHSYQDIEDLLTTMATLLPEWLRESGSTIEEIHAAFARIRTRLNVGLAG